tara:strand:- start:2253 stop:2573 length:321 start_codon:yes stop_codon:yes gene_type:complete
MQDMSLNLPQGKNNNDDDALYVMKLANLLSKYDTHTGPVRTQFDMSKEEISALEKKYGAKIQMEAPIETHGTLDDKSVSNNWFYRNRMKKQKMLEAKRKAEENAAG